MDCPLNGTAVLKRVDILVPNSRPTGLFFNTLPTLCVCVFFFQYLPGICLPAGLCFLYFSLCWPLLKKLMSFPRSGVLLFLVYLFPIPFSSFSAISPVSSLLGGTGPGPDIIHPSPPLHVVRYIGGLHFDREKSSATFVSSSTRVL